MEHYNSCQGHKLAVLPVQGPSSPTCAYIPARGTQACPGEDMGLVEIKIHHQDVCLLLSGRQKQRRTDSQGFMLRVLLVGNYFHHG